MPIRLTHKIFYEDRITCCKYKALAELIAQRDSHAKLSITTKVKIFFVQHPDRHGMNFQRYLMTKVEHRQGVAFVGPLSASVLIST